MTEAAVVHLSKCPQLRVVGLYDLGRPLTTTAAKCLAQCPQLQSVATNNILSGGAMKNLEAVLKNKFLQGRTWHFWAVGTEPESGIENFFC